MIIFQSQQMIIIDEIGKMELFSKKFIAEVRRVFDSPQIVILATIPVPKGKPLQLVEELRGRQDCEVVTVSEDT